MDPDVGHCCGLFGIFGAADAVKRTYLGLFSLQHRGQESAGIVWSDGRKVHSKLGMGLVNANIMKVVIVFAYTPIALVLFFVEGMVELVPGLILALGQAAGAWLGAATALKRGADLIRLMLLFVVTVSALELLGGFAWLARLLS